MSEARDLGSPSLVEETLEDHIADCAWFISQFDEEQDAFVKLKWITKALDRLEDDERDALEIEDLDGELYRYGSAASAIENALHPVISTATPYHISNMELRDRRHIPLPSWIRMPAKGSMRHEEYLERDHGGELRRFLRLAGCPDLDYGFAVDEGAALFPGGRERGDEVRETRFDPSILMLEEHDFQRLRSGFAFRLDRFTGKIARRIRTHLLEPRGVMLRHVKMKEGEGKG